MTPQSSQNVLESKQIKIRCPDCAVRLCDRKIIDDGWLLYLRFSRSRKGKVTEVYATEFVIKCGTCGARSRIKADEGILESYGKNIRGQSGDTGYVVDPRQT